MRLLALVATGTGALETLGSSANGFLLVGHCLSPVRIAFHNGVRLAGYSPVYDRQRLSVCTLRGLVRATAIGSRCPINC